MTNTLKHLALLARMESSGLKLGLTGKFPEDALDQTCERVETFQLQNRLRTGNDNTQIQKELVRTPEFAALYHALCNDGVDDRSITSMLQSAIACDEQLTQYPKEQVLAAAGTDIPLSLRFYYMKFYLPFIKYEEEGEAIIDNINAFPATEREELSALTDAQKNMMRQPFLGPYLFNWNNNTREALELLEQNKPLQRVLTLLYRQGVALDLNAARLKDLCWVETADVMKFRRLLAAFEYDTEDLNAFFERWLENHAGQYDLNWFISHTAPLDKGQRQEILRNDLSYLNALYSGRLHLDFSSIRRHQFPILTYAVRHGKKHFLDLVSEHSELFLSLGRYALLFEDTLSNLCLIAPVSLLVMVIWELLNVISGQESSMRDHAALFICGTVVMFIIVFLSQWLQYNKTYTVAYEESANRRIVLAEKLRKLPLSFFGQRDLSDLTTTIMGDCTALERVFSNAIPQLFGTIFMFVITAIGLLALDWRMGLCIVVPVPVAALVVFAAKKAQSNAESANMDAKRAAYDGVQEYLDTIQELKSCSREEEYLEGLEKKLDYVVKCSFHNEIAPGAATTTAQFILRFGLVAVMLVGGILVTAGSLSIPMFILFLLFAGRIYDPFTSCFMLMAEVFSALVSVKRMKQIDATPEQTGTNVCNNKGYDIEFKNVVFSYNEEPVLKGVSFVAKQGEVTALVGPSGSGKSTASKLAARFWDADSGIITLGGVDVKTVEPETLFKNYAIVFQDVMLFDETVMENIRLGRGDATDEEVMAAARAAQCEEFIQRLPQGYQTNIGENGSALSGGERQRISIARALLKNAPIVLLDEATASMDAESETLVQDALSVLLKDKTVMVIAHRMRTVANADKIVVLDDGKVSEMGTPAELMAKGGLYSHLVALQQGR